MIKLISIIFLFISYNAIAQDTFSIVAVDSVTGEVGSSGASCVPKYILDNFKYSYHFIGQLFVAKGAINTQALYIFQNQQNAASRMYAGDTPAEIINWLSKPENDFEGNPNVRQYGIVALIDGKPQAAAFTGKDCLDWKGHITGQNYSIQGNILLGKQVLDSMEARFLRTEGTLSDKLMAALQGAKIIGADTRCSDNGTSTLFAYIKVAKPGDNPELPGLLLSLATNDGDRIEPIDSLQNLYNKWKSTSSVAYREYKLNEFVYPNPAGDYVRINTILGKPLSYTIYSVTGVAVIIGNSSGKIDISSLESGIYLLKFDNRLFRLIKL